MDDITQNQAQPEQPKTPEQPKINEPKVAQPPVGTGPVGKMPSASQQPQQKVPQAPKQPSLNPDSDVNKERYSKLKEAAEKEREEESQQYNQDYNQYEKEETLEDLYKQLGDLENQRQEELKKVGELYGINLPELNQKDSSVGINVSMASRNMGKNANIMFQNWQNKDFYNIPADKVTGFLSNIVDYRKKFNKNPKAFSSEDIKMFNALGIKGSELDKLSNNDIQIMAMMNQRQHDLAESSKSLTANDFMSKEGRAVYDIINKKGMNSLSDKDRSKIKELAKSGVIPYAELQMLKTYMNDERAMLPYREQEQLRKDWEGKQAETKSKYDELSDRIREKLENSSVSRSENLPNVSDNSGTALGIINGNSPLAKDKLDLARRRRNQQLWFGNWANQKNLPAGRKSFLDKLFGL